MFQHAAVFWGRILGNVDALLLGFEVNHPPFDFGTHIDILDTRDL